MFRPIALERLDHERLDDGSERDRDDRADGSSQLCAEQEREGHHDRVQLRIDRKRTDFVAGAGVEPNERAGAARRGVGGARLTVAVVACFAQTFYDRCVATGELPNVRERRRLAAIVAIDVVGYSRLMGSDEAGTLARLKALRRNIFDPLDVVSAADPYLGDDYQRDSRVVVEDVTVQNQGTWRHSISKYLQRSEVRSRLTEMVGG
jgi:hypothetical protein